ncbi:esterase/lipase family protein [Coralloluteibacterium stylophorae]|uniref:Alpha/beta fold hydrolase n=1 Tax=Coralloluteibacterium stylophorae TaxID=1776034 RepID=A0A8J7VUA4_9GAMM|nr:alpha/beta fold hydrolase [Coralloluteibacterium stylophorae]MBS7456783.1 alpha/beta fold hydrolase [Coralloluteibacterium stylophorae]
MPAPSRVILVHGLWTWPLSMEPLARRLRAGGFVVGHFGYRTVREDGAGAVARLVERIDRDGPVALVGHSMGGLLALRAAAERCATVPRIVCLASPLHGSPTAAALARLPGGVRLLGHAAENLARTAAAPGRCEVGMVAGCSGRGLGRVLRRFDGVHDGTVALEETRAEWLADHCVVAASHSGILFSREAAACCAAFLRHGRFGSA